MILVFEIITKIIQKLKWESFCSSKVNGKIILFKPKKEFISNICIIKKVKIITKIIHNFKMKSFYAPSVFGGRLPFNTFSAVQPLFCVYPTIRKNI